MLREGSRWRTLGFCSFVALTSAVGCGPMRMGFDVVIPPTDATSAEAGPDVETDGPRDVVRDARADARIDAAPACNDDDCTDRCVAAGSMRGGFCRANGMCFCIDLPEGGTLDDASSSGDGPSGPLVTGCATNEDCPPSMFCNGTACDGRGYCAFRGEMTPSACPASTNPSCGCDGRLYPSVCMRLSSGVRQAPRATCGGADGGTPADASPGDAAPTDAAPTDGAAADVGGLTDAARD